MLQLSRGLIVGRDLEQLYDLFRADTPVRIDIRIGKVQLYAGTKNHRYSLGPIACVAAVDSNLSRTDYSRPKAIIEE